MEARPRGRFDWQEQAACAILARDIGIQAVDQMFFIEWGESAEPAKTVCDSCDVEKECLDYALELNIAFGVYGGASARERRRMRLKR